MTVVLLDTHTVAWWSTDSSQLSGEAMNAISEATDLAVSAVTWWELAQMAVRGRIELPLPTRRWLLELASAVRSVGITPTIALTAATLPATFPGDPADRLIYATAIEHGWPLVTKDRRLRGHGDAAGVTVW